MTVRETRPLKPSVIDKLIGGLARTKGDGSRDIAPCYIAALDRFNESELKNCVIRAPISGTITAKVAEKGVLVNPLAFSAAAGSGGIGTIADLADMEADLEIAEREIALLAVGMACTVKVNAYPNRPYTGVIDRILPQANRAKSVVSVRVKVALLAGEQPGAYLKPEMGAVVTFRAAEAK